MSLDLTSVSRSGPPLSWAPHSDAPSDPSRAILLKTILKNFVAVGLDVSRWTNYFKSHYFEPMFRYYAGQAKDLNARIELYEKELEAIKHDHAKRKKYFSDQLKAASAREGSTSGEKDLILAQALAQGRAFKAELESSEPFRQQKIFKSILELYTEKFSSLQSLEHRLNFILKQLQSSQIWRANDGQRQMTNALADLSDLVVAYGEYSKLQSCDMNQLANMVEAMDTPDSLTIVNQDDNLHPKELDVVMHLQHLLLQKLAGDSQDTYFTFDVELDFVKGRENVSFVAYQNKGHWQLLGDLRGKTSGFLRSSQFSAVFCQKPREASKALMIPASVMQIDFSLSGQDIESRHQAAQLAMIGGELDPALFERLNCHARIGFTLAPHGVLESNFVEAKAVIRLSDKVVTTLTLPPVEVLERAFPNKPPQELMMFIQSCLASSLDEFVAGLQQDIRKNFNQQFTLVLPAYPAQREALYEEATLELIEEAVKKGNFDFIEWLIQEDSAPQPLLGIERRPAICYTPLSDASGEPSPSDTIPSTEEELLSVAEQFIQEKNARIKRLKGQVEIEDVKSDEPDLSSSSSSTVRQTREQERKLKQEQYAQQQAYLLQKKNKKQAQVQRPSSTIPITEQLKSKDRAILDAILQGTPVNNRQYKRVIQELLKAKYKSGYSAHHRGSHLNVQVPNGGFTLVEDHGGHETSAFNQKKTIQSIIRDDVS